MVYHRSYKVSDLSCMCQGITMAVFAIHACPEKEGPRRGASARARRKLTYSGHFHRNKEVPGGQHLRGHAEHKAT